MTVYKRRMKQLRGPWDKFNSDELTAGEFATVTSGGQNSSDGKELHYAFAPGDVKQLMTCEDGRIMIENATDELSERYLKSINETIDEAEDAISSAESAANFANNIAEDLIAKRDAGVFTGPQGENGVVVVTQGQVAFQILDGDLILYYHEGDTAPDYSIDANGDLILDIGGDL